jgi:hypothetical protein
MAYNTVALGHHDPAWLKKGGKRDPAKALEFHLKALTVRERVTRARLFARLGLKGRVAADVGQALRRKPADPRALVEAGRVMAELGAHPEADAVFARAAALTPGEPGRFLEAGWWVVGPYPDRLDLPCPPEFNPDPSRPVAAVGRAAELTWKTVPTTAHTAAVTLRATVGDARNVTYYALALVYADRDRTASVHLRTGDDARRAGGPPNH